MKRKVIIVGQLQNRGKFETGQVLSPKGICRALKSTDYKNPPFIEVGYATIRQRTLKQIVPALTKPCGSSGCPYLLVDSEDGKQTTEENR